jgi:serine/threonine-protein kinase
MYLSDAMVRGLRAREREVIADRFEIIDEAGVGGMGTVYRARDLSTDGPVAVKVLKTGCDTARFALEAQILARLDHPHVVGYVAHGTTNQGDPFLAMDWLEGQSLSARLAGRMPTVEETVRLGRDLADALAAAHALGVVHRDLKPSNVFLRGGRLDDSRLLDFGVARARDLAGTLTQTGQVIGTAGYMAPEQARGRRDIDARVDLFSLGCVLYRCLGGRPAFDGSDVLSVLAKLVLHEPPRLSSMREDLPAELDELVAGLLAKQPSRRPRSAEHVRAELDRIGRECLGADRTAAKPTRAPSDARLFCVMLASAPPGVEPAAGAVERLRDQLSGEGAALELLADGALVVSLPVDAGAAVTEAERAARCARLLAAALPGARMSVAAGRGFRDERGGEVIDLAGRLLAEATPGSTRVERPDGETGDAAEQQLRAELVRALADAGVRAQPITRPTAPAPSAAFEGLVASKYRITGLLGAGGMGAVYDARNEATHRRVALKMISAGPHSSDPASVARFEREARAAGVIDTPHIAQVLDAGVDATTGRPFLVMEYLAGEDAQRLLSRLGPLPPALALRIAAQAAVGLARAHEAGVIHRDIKPANLFLTRSGDGKLVVKLLDFGVAKLQLDGPMDEAARTLTRTGSMIGSPAYMSPEQAKSLKSIDHRTDLWSLGAVLYELLSGRQPHADAESIGGLIVAICTEEPPNVQRFAPWVAADIAGLVGRCLRIAPDQRFGSTATLLDELRALLPGGFDLDESMLLPLSADERGNAPASPASPKLLALAHTLPAPSIREAPRQQAVIRPATDDAPKSMSTADGIASTKTWSTPKTSTGLRGFALIVGVAAAGVGYLYFTSARDPEPLQADDALTPAVTSVPASPMASPDPIAVVTPPVAPVAIDAGAAPSASASAARPDARPRPTARPAAATARATPSASPALPPASAQPRPREIDTDFR